MKAKLSVTLCLLMLLVGCGQSGGGATNESPKPPYLEPSQPSVSPMDMPQRTDRLRKHTAQQGVTYGNVYSNAWANIKCTLPDDLEFEPQDADFQSADTFDHQTLFRVENDEFTLKLGILNAYFVAYDKEMTPEELLEYTRIGVSSGESTAMRTPANNITIAEQEFIYFMEQDDLGEVDFRAGRMITDDYMITILYNGPFKDYKEVLKYFMPAGGDDSEIGSASTGSGKFVPGTLSAGDYSNEWINLRFTPPDGFLFVNADGELDPSDAKHKAGDFIYAVAFSAQDSAKQAGANPLKAGMELTFLNYAIYSDIGKGIKTTEEYLEYFKAQGDAKLVKEYTPTSKRRIGADEYAFTQYTKGYWTQAVCVRLIDGYFVQIVVEGNMTDIEKYFNSFTKY